MIICFWIFDNLYPKILFYFSFKYWFGILYYLCGLISWQKRKLYTIDLTILSNRCNLIKYLKLVLASLIQGNNTISLVQSKILHLKSIENTRIFNPDIWNSIAFYAKSFRNINSILKNQFLYLKNLDKIFNSCWVIIEVFFFCKNLIVSWLLILWW